MVIALWLYPDFQEEFQISHQARTVIIPQPSLSKHSVLFVGQESFLKSI